DELDLAVQDGEKQVRTRRNLPEGFSWGPFQGSIHSEPTSPGHGETQSPPVTLVLGDESCWLSQLPLVPGETDANAVIYRKDEALWCRTTRALQEDECLCAFVVAEPPAIANHHTVKAEPGESSYPAALHSDIQLLPQQAGMAAILATAVVNKDVFPCKDCGIWYRSERNLQAHLMYYCASRQSAGSPALEEKPKETYPNERVCPFPQCKKSCPSASSLEIHMRSHSGERPFVCLICLSAFTTKANCERHLKVHTDTLNGVCHSCGFISTTRDILYSHLVTNHMICQPGSKGEVYSPGTTLPATKPLTTGLSQPNNAPQLRKCSLPAFLPEGLPALPQHVVLHGTLPTPPPGPDSAAHPAPPSSPHDAKADKLSPPAQPQNGEGPSSSSSSSTSSSEAIRIKEEPAGSPASEAGVPKSGGTEEGGGGSPDACSRTSSPHSLPSAKVKLELASPTPGSSPVPSEPGTGTAGGTVFLPQYVFGHEAAVVPQASEILAKMSELVHNRLKQGHGGTVPPAIYTGTPVPKGATCFECEITFNNINNYYVHKRLYCSSRHLAEDSPPGARKLKAPSGPLKGPPTPGTLLSPSAGDGQGTPVGDGDAGRDATVPVTTPEVKVEDGGAKAGSPEVEGGSGRCSEDSQSPSSSAGDEGDEDPSKTLCEACNIRFSRHETYVVHKRFYCASRHDPPLRRPNLPKIPFLPQPLRTRKRRKLYEIHGTAQRPAEPPPAPTEPLPAPDPAAGAAASPRSSPDADGPIDLSKKPRRQGEPAPAPMPPLADYHECTACRISFNSLDAYLAHKKYQCPATPLQPRTLEHLQKMKGTMPTHLKGCRSPGSPTEGDPESVRGRAAPAGSPGITYSGTDSLQRHPKGPLSPPGVKGPLSTCPYCPLNGVIKGDLLEHFRNTHGLFVAKLAAAGQGIPDALVPGASRTPDPPLPTASPPHPPAPRLHRDSFNGKEGRDGSSPRPPTSPRPPASPGAPEGLREGARKPPSPPTYTDRGVQTPPAKAVPSPVPNGNHRYCRLCNIKFSSLSTFIAHKKYYCSSHAAEHVK
ncbi:FOG1 protein, partial [Indicator maculatus]|nr:FOG1 protein [Indicator maculatus]